MRRGIETGHVLFRMMAAEGLSVSGHVGCADHAP